MEILGYTGLDFVVIDTERGPEPLIMVLKELSFHALKALMTSGRSWNWASSPRLETEDS